VCPILYVALAKINVGVGETRMLACKLGRVSRGWWDLHEDTGEVFGKIY
jgi:hypothetical protein